MRPLCPTSAIRRIRPWINSSMDLTDEKSDRTSAAVDELRRRPQTCECEAWAPVVILEIRPAPAAPCLFNRKTVLSPGATR